jgi:hypothetical protein
MKENEKECLVIIGLALVTGMFIGSIVTHASMTT